MERFLSSIPKNLLIILKAAAYRSLNKPIAPRILTYEVTRRCNCRCFMCEVYKENPLEEELTYSAIRKVFQDKMLKDIDLIRVTGGEPLLKNDLAEIIKTIYCSTKCKIFHIVTNGSMTEKTIDFIKNVTDYGIFLHLQISLDAVGDLHDKIRGFSGLFKTVYKTLEEVKKLQEKKSFFVGINQTITRENVKQIDEVNKLAEGFGFAHNIAIANVFHEGRNICFDSLKYAVPFKTLSQFSKDELINLYATLEEIASRNRMKKLNKNYFGFYLRNLSEVYLIDGGKNRLLLNKNIPKPKCMALFSYFRLHCNGDIATCYVKSKSVIGNVRNQPFSKIWHSEEALTERKAVNSCKGCWVECEVVPNAFYSGDIIGWFLKKQFSKLFK